MAQRNLSERDVWYIIRHGRQYRSGGVVHYFLGKKDIPKDDAPDDAITKLEGATVLVALSEDQMKVVTVYRNKKASRHIRRKPKYNYKTAPWHDELPLAG